MNTGESFVFDRSNQSVYSINPSESRAIKIVQIGSEDGNILGASAFDLGPNKTFAVADSPNRRERVQIFSLTGTRLGGFTLPGRSTPRLTLNGIVLNGVSSLQHTGQTILMNQPETNSLITEYSLFGSALRNIGNLRKTGYEDDRNLHLALNTGLPLTNSSGEFYFVFQSGIPIFRKYDASGSLIFERHVEGPELDQIISSLPNTWPKQTTADGLTLPIVPPIIRTAAVDPKDNLWIGLTVPYTYVYDSNGEKIRTVQFQGAGILTPSSFFFSDPNVLLITPGCYEFTVN